jgi:hypothetical protein
VHPSIATNEFVANDCQVKLMVDSEDLSRLIRRVQQTYEALETRIRGSHPEAYDDDRSKFTDLKQAIDRLGREIIKLENSSPHTKAPLPQQRS